MPKTKTGFTLVELLVSSYILAIGICGLLLLFVNTMKSADWGWDTTVAVTHAQSILEEMHTRNTLSEVVSTDWHNWALDQKLTSLPQEAVQVVYVDPQQDPLDIRVTINWQRAGEPNAVSLQTKLTR